MPGELEPCKIGIKSGRPSNTGNNDQSAARKQLMVGRANISKAASGRMAEVKFDHDTLIIKGNPENKDR